MKIKALQAFTIRDTSTGDLTSIASGTAAIEENEQWMKSRKSVKSHM